MDRDLAEYQIAAIASDSMSFDYFLAIPSPLVAHFGIRQLEQGRYYRDEAFAAVSYSSRNATQSAMRLDFAQLPICKVGVESVPYSRKWTAASVNRLPSDSEYLRRIIQLTLCRYRGRRGRKTARANHERVYQGRKDKVYVRRNPCCEDSNQAGSTRCPAGLAPPS
ncbi:hypothetical protein KM043_016243 [Ampulex compressa]|nr:hypothetical protein KM043_016243 [Ampulex compressa]